MMTMFLHWAVVAVIVFVFLCNAAEMDRYHPSADKFRWAALMVCSVASIPEFQIGEWVMGVGALLFAIMQPNHYGGILGLQTRGDE